MLESCNSVSMGQIAGMLEYCVDYWDVRILYFGQYGADCWDVRI